MKKLINIIIVTLFCGALVITSNKINKLENQIKSLNNKEVVQASATEEAEKENIKPIAATQENKKVINIVKEETNNNTIKKEVIEEPATEEAGESQEQQSGHTEEDYNRYLEYKSNLIKEYGEDVYKLMNQEAGIETEEESFNHFMEYGI